MYPPPGGSLPSVAPANPSLAPPTSSPPAILDPALYPTINNWFKELEDSPRADGHHFAHYGPQLENEGFGRLYQLCDLTVQELKDICIGMREGHARLILRFAKDDCRKIRA
jgi:hypothetical protein